MESVVGRLASLQCDSLVWCLRWSTNGNLSPLSSSLCCLHPQGTHGTIETIVIPNPAGGLVTLWDFEDCTTSVPDAAHGDVTATSGFDDVGNLNGNAVCTSVPANDEYPCGSNVAAGMCVYV